MGRRPWSWRRGSTPRRWRGWRMRCAGSESRGLARSCAMPQPCPWWRLAARGVHFLSYDPAPAERLDNLHVVPSPDWPGGDLIASSDVVVAKAGYGTACEAMASGTPMVYPPRRGFAEFRPLDRALRGW